MNPDTTSATAVQPPPATTRLGSIDAYRGLVMLLMLGEMLEFAHIAKKTPDSAFWSFLAYHQDHVKWIGCSLHDLIQPSFSFLVGVAMIFSLAKRATLGQPLWQRSLHAFWRAAALVLLGVFIRSLYGFKQTNWTFDDTLAQIGLGYGFLYIIAQFSRRVQWSALGVILVGYWIAFAVYPLPGEDFNWKAVGVPANWPHLTGFAAHWDINSNIASAFDQWFLNKFPRERPFIQNGGYVTLSFIPTLGTMILGLLAGGMLRGESSAKQKMTWLLLAGLIGIVAGWTLGAMGICPVVKKIWTPSWVLFSGGWCFLILAMFYAIVDIRRQGVWAFPLIVIGTNSIVAYISAWMWKDFFQGSLLKHFGWKPFIVCSEAAQMIVRVINDAIHLNLNAQSFAMINGSTYQHLMLAIGALFAQWLLLLWMYRRKAFLNI